MDGGSFLALLVRTALIWTGAPSWPFSYAPGWDEWIQLLTGQARPPGGERDASGDQALALLRRADRLRSTTRKVNRRSTYTLTERGASCASASVRSYVH